MNNRTKGILLNTIIGDALGSSFDGFSRGHVNSMYTEINEYAEPKLNKSNFNKWRKPGLYTSISQFLFIATLAFIKSKFKKSSFINLIADSPKNDENRFGIFRHPGQTERNFLNNINNAVELNTFSGIPSARVLPVSLPLIIKNINKKGLLCDVISLISVFTNDQSTISGAILFSELIKILNGIEMSDTDSFVTLAAESGNDIFKNIENNSRQIFELGLNPETILLYNKKYTILLKEIQTVKDKNTVEEIICKNLNKTLKSPVKRATVDNPLAIIPFSLYLMDLYKNNPEKILFQTALEGGAVSSLTSITGAFLGSISGESFIPEVLIKNLVNRKKILTIIEKIAEGRIQNNQIEEFLLSENSLTQKEIQELKAKLKNTKPSSKKDAKKAKKSRKEKEQELTDHIVESWTKMDKAKWKKQKKGKTYKNI